jgi:galactokinase
MLGDAAHQIDRLTLATWCQRAENEFVGARCGIMDQYIACFGAADTALLIDCRSLEHRALPLPATASLVVLNTMVKHAIASGEYNARRADCEGATAALSRVLPDVRTLRDVTMKDLVEHGSALPASTCKRARHVVTENARALAAADALQNGNLTQFGALMADSHRSLRDDFEVSCRELDVMVELATSEPDVFGTRMIGGGFGGCTLSLVKRSAATRFARTMQRRYEQATGTRPDAWVCVASRSAEELPNESGRQ